MSWTSAPQALCIPQSAASAVSLPLIFHINLSGFVFRDPSLTYLIMLTSSLLLDLSFSCSVMVHTVNVYPMHDNIHQAVHLASHKSKLFLSDKRQTGSRGVWVNPHSGSADPVSWRSSHNTVQEHFPPWSLSNNLQSRELLHGREDFTVSEVGLGLVR